MGLLPSSAPEPAAFGQAVPEPLGKGMACGAGALADALRVARYGGSFCSLRWQTSNMELSNQPVIQSFFVYTYIYIYMYIYTYIYIYMVPPPPQKKKKKTQKKQKHTPQENLTVFAVLLCDFQPLFRPFNFYSFQALQL